MSAAEARAGKDDEGNRDRPRGGIVSLSVKKTAELRPHEETVEGFSRSLMERMRRNGVQADPIMIDGRSGVVLDGMHRLAAFKMMKVPTIVCCLIDYKSSEVKILRWGRVVTWPTQALLERVREDFDLGYEPRDVSGGLTRYEKPVVTILGKVYPIERSSYANDLPSTIRHFDSIVAEEGRRVDFMDESSFGDEEALNREGLVLVMPRFEKRDVIEAGESGALLPPKSTRHEFPLRPVGIDYPLEKLLSGEDILEGLLAERKERIVEGPAFRGGKLYRERLLVYQR